MLLERLTFPEIEFKITKLQKGLSRAFWGRGICHLFRQYIGNLGFRIAGNGMRYIQGIMNFLIFLLGYREKYEMIALYQDEKFWRDLIKHKWDSLEICIQYPPLDPIISWHNFSRELLNCHCFREGSQSKT